ncbi:MAG: PIG-L family deacetylase [Deinococcales bacterium]
MTGLELKPGAPLHIVCIGAHSDDAEIGAAGTVLHLVKLHPASHVRWIVLSSTPERADEARESASTLLSDFLEPEILVFDFRDGFLPYQGMAVKEAFESLKGGPAPDVIFTHAHTDLHQDHRLAAELTWNTWRDNLILEYEIPKYDGDLARPGVYVPLSQDIVNVKLDHLERNFASQRSKPWYDRETFQGLMRLRGLECRAPSGYAEAFQARKLVLD